MPFNFRSAAAALVLSMGCAATPKPVAVPADPWPPSVAKRCPKRQVPLCCFRKQAIETAMQGLIGAVRDCHLPDAPPVLVELTIETRGGKPTCVEQVPRSHPSARCVATAVARHLSIPDSPADEGCSIRYPIRFESMRPPKDSDTE